MLLIYIILSAILVIAPVIKSLKTQEACIYKNRERELRIRWIQRCYPELKDLSWEEMERNYSIGQLYNNIR